MCELVGEIAGDVVWGGFCPWSVVIDLVVVNYLVDTSF